MKKENLGSVKALKKQLGAAVAMAETVNAIAVRDNLVENFIQAS